MAVADTTAEDTTAGDTTAADTTTTMPALSSVACAAGAIIGESSPRNHASTVAAVDIQAGAIRDIDPIGPTTTLSSPTTGLVGNAIRPISEYLNEAACGSGGVAQYVDSRVQPIDIRCRCDTVRDGFLNTVLRQNDKTITSGYHDRRRASARRMERSDPRSRVMAIRFSAATSPRPTA